MFVFLPSTIFGYWYWYFVDRPKVIFQAWVNFLEFGLKFFSVFYLLRTLFAPFHLYQESYGRGFDLQRWLTAAFSNFIFRTLGAISRLVFIALGIIFETAVFVLGFSILIIWLFLPLIIVGLIVFGFKLLLAS